MLESFFEPQSVVIIGASQTPGKIGHTLLQNLENFSGKIWALNPKGGSHFFPKSQKKLEFQKKLSNISETPDIAVIAIPAPFVEKTLKECGEKGIKNVIIISAGFKEMGNVESEKNLQKISEEFSINLLGPNCLGMMNIQYGLNLSFAENNPKKGDIAFVSQSGAMATALMDFASAYDICFSKVISMGNKAGLNENNFLEYLENEEQTRVIVMYIEDIIDGKKFLENCKRITKKKPVIIVKSGVSQKGAIAAASHTGALSGARNILETAFVQSGVIFTHALEELFVWSRFFSHLDEENIEDELILVTNAGGPGVMAIDNAELFGVHLAEFSDSEKNILKAGLPDAASVNNPVDILGDATSERYITVLKNITQLKKKRNILVMLTHQAGTDTDTIAKSLIAFQENFPDQLILVSFMGGKSVAPGRAILQEHTQKNFLHFEYPRQALNALSQYKKWKQWKEKSSDVWSLYSLTNKIKGGQISENIRTQIQKEKNEGTGILSADLTTQIFDAYNIPFVSEKLARSEDEAAEIFETLGAPVVMKISSPHIPHKTDCGGVVLNVSSVKKARKFFTQILKNSQNAHPKAEISGVTLQKMLPKSQEIFIGATRDATFGEVILFGYGGIYVNIFKDISRRILPISRNEINEMMREISTFPILEGVRGEQGVDLDAIAESIEKIALLFVQNPEISEIDINPLFAEKNGAWIVDAKLFV